MTDNLLGTLLQPLDVHNGQSCMLQTLPDFRTTGIHGYSIFRHNNVNRTARRDERGYLVYHAWNSATQQRTNDDGQRRVGSCVGMAAYGSADDAIATHQHVHVEVHVNFQSRQNNNVQEVSCRAWFVGARIFYG